MHMVSKNIKRLRVKQNMTQEDLAGKMYVTRQTVSNWENGKNQPDIETLERLAVVFETDIHELIYGVRQGGYPRYQRRFVFSLLLCGVCLLLLIISSDYLRSIDHFEYTIAHGALFYGERMLAYLLAGYALMSGLSLWFDCSAKRGWGYVAFAVLFLLPSLFMLLCITTGISGSAVMILYHAFARSSFRIALCFQLFPCLSGILFFLHFHRLHRPSGDEERR